MSWRLHSRKWVTAAGIHYGLLSARSRSFITRRVRSGQVACLSDGDAHLALDKEDPFTVQTKPHGHGDVHALLHSSGLLRRWVAAGVKWVAFFQDTNALVFRGLPAAIGARVAPGPCERTQRTMQLSWTYLPPEECSV